ncbi:hypothetical protein DMENIID0001_057810 [Sergentomyia squamirostris]
MRWLGERREGWHEAQLQPVVGDGDKSQAQAVQRFMRVEVISTLCVQMSENGTVRDAHTTNRCSQLYMDGKRVTWRIDEGDNTSSHSGA